MDRGGATDPTSIRPVRSAGVETKEGFDGSVARSAPQPVASASVPSTPISLIILIRPLRGTHSPVAHSTYVAEQLAADRNTRGARGAADGLSAPGNCCHADLTIG
ncbi:hypothetical protein RE9427_46310 [Prescottella equi]|nr:hypothetical protein RE9427_46310 [Prescottella equi]BDE61559.1 hypothetical protein REA19_45750 [Prescottella equi]